MLERSAWLPPALKREALLEAKPHFTREAVCVLSFVDFLKIEVVHSILFTINLIFKHYFRLYVGLMKDLHFFIF